MTKSRPAPSRNSSAISSRRIGIALGSGAARGWAHVGVLRALEERGIQPEIVCGSSAGALVGALYAANRLDELERFGRALDRRRIMGFFDVSLRGGLIKARKLIDGLTSEFQDLDLEDLGRTFAAVATDLETGREVWLRKGSVADSLRGAIALPGLVSPVELDGRWVVDGGLVNPVPVSVCRALGAEIVIAVDLNTMLLGRRLLNDGASEPGEHGEQEATPPGREKQQSASSERGVLQELMASLRERFESGNGAHEPGPSTSPSIYEVIANAINIMQVRITRSRMSGDPPDILVTPQLSSFGLLDFDRAAEAIAEGRRALAHALGEI